MFKNKKLFVLSTFLLVSLIFFNQKRLEFYRSDHSFSAESVFFSKPVYRFITLGFKDFFDDLAYIWVLGELGQPSEKVDREALDVRVSSLLSLEPRIESFYTLSCFVYHFELFETQRCLKVLETGKEALPQSWRVLFTLGYIYAFELSDYKKGSLYYKKASQIPGAPDYLESLSNSILEKKGVGLDKKSLERAIFE